MDINKINENYKKIKGIFITHGHESNMGALSDIIMDLPNIPIYGSKFTIEIIKLQLENDGIKKGLHVDKTCKNKNGDMVI